jgi:hypothetical protein
MCACPNCCLVNKSLQHKLLCDYVCCSRLHQMTWLSAGTPLPISYKLFFHSFSLIYIINHFSTFYAHLVVFFVYVPLHDLYFYPIFLLVNYFPLSICHLYRRGGGGCTNVSKVETNLAWANLSFAANATIKIPMLTQ